MLGHASAAMTLDVYAGLFGDDLDDLADRLDRAAMAAAADQVRTDRPRGTSEGCRRGPRRCDLQVLGWPCGPSVHA